MHSSLFTLITRTQSKTPFLRNFVTCINFSQQNDRFFGLFRSHLKVRDWCLKAPC